MIMDSLPELHCLIDIKPHSHRRNPLTKGKLSEETVQSIKDFVLKVCRLTKHTEDIDTLFCQYGDEFRGITSQIKSESIKEGKAKESFTAMEYLEAVYIVSFYLIKNLGYTQKKIAECFGFKAGNYRTNWGITPDLDVTASTLSCNVSLPIEEKSLFLKEIIPFIGRVSANISNSFSLYLTNDIDIIANIPTSNKKISNSRQLLFNIKEDADMHKWVFYEQFCIQPAKIKELILNLIDEKDKQLSAEIFEKIQGWGIKIREENLKEPCIQRFNDALYAFNSFIENRELLLEARDDPSHDADDVFLSEDKNNTVNKQEYCDKEIARLDKEIGRCLDFMTSVINFSSLDVGQLPLIKFLVEKYEDELYKNPKEDLFLDTASFCAKYFIHRFFSLHGVSQESFNQFKDYLLSSDMRKYATNYNFADLKLIMNGTDIKTKQSVADIISDLKIAVNTSKENRIWNTALIYIDLDVFSLTEEEINDLLAVDEKFYFIFISSRELGVSLNHVKRVIDDTEYHIYINEEIEL